MSMQMKTRNSTMTYVKLCDNSTLCSTLMDFITPALAFTMQWANSTDNKLMILFLFFLENRI